jgi:glycosyltransferase involved in cell wall biosynthesis
MLWIGEIMIAVTTEQSDSIHDKAGNKLRIAILGTRGIPNYYGGFEQCAEKLSLHFVKEKHDVSVYNPTEHPFKEKEWKGIKIEHIFSSEKRLKFLNTFLFDYLSLRDALRKNFDIILELGHSPNALYYYLKKNSGPKIVTNMAGLEWKRSKWKPAAKKIIKYTERLAVNKSDAIISDNQGISDYITEEYGKNSYCVPYGAELFNGPEEEYLEQYGIEKYGYYLLVARFQPDNNIEMILDGYVLSQSSKLFIVIGNHTNSYGTLLKSKYKNNLNIKFLDGIYNYELLSSIRWFGEIYFHGHSCGGTNPSLLEAMASNAFIASHDNPFNRHVLGENALYFSNSGDVAALIENNNSRYRESFITNNREKISALYNWDSIAAEYLNIFRRTLAGVDLNA